MSYLLLFRTRDQRLCAPPPQLKVGLDESRRCRSALKDLAKPRVGFSRGSGYAICEASHRENEERHTALEPRSPGGLAIHRVGLIVPGGFHIMSYATLATFDTANFVANETFYDASILSENGGPVHNNLGVATETAALDVKPFDTLLLGAGFVLTPPSRKLSAFLCGAVKDGRRVASICLGTFALAEAGILDGRRATTHWFFSQQLAQRFPKVRVEMDRIFIADGPVWTSAGMTAGVDMALSLVERDMGADVARATAKMMVVHHRRAGGQSQHSAMFDLDAKSDRVQDALTFAKKNLRAPLTIEQLADAARLSPRHFTRVFRMETGLSPARAVENLRLEAARYLLEQGRLPIEEIARETGFVDRERMRRSFMRTYGQTPQAIRNASHPLATI
jgi:transcriptional regulator GlxA family with amidase domain